MTSPAQDGAAQCKPCTARWLLLIPQPRCESTPADGCVPCEGSAQPPPTALPHGSWADLQACAQQASWLCAVAGVENPSGQASQACSPVPGTQQTNRRTINRPVFEVTNCPTPLLHLGFFSKEPLFPAVTPEYLELVRCKQKSFMMTSRKGPHKGKQATQYLFLLED